MVGRRCARMREKGVFCFVFHKWNIYIYKMKPHNTMDIINKHFAEEYQTPAMRVINPQFETSFLASNLEPIDGGDDPDIDW